MLHVNQGFSLKAAVAAFVLFLVMGLPGICSAQETSTLCRFEKGPRAGETQDYAPMAPLAVGASCHDGAGSSGRVIAADKASSQGLPDLEALLARNCDEGAPGAAIVGIRNGETIIRHACGLADLEHGIPLEPDMVFRLASVTKQFTAVAILLLEQEGKLELSDDITEHLPEYASPEKTITIEHLLTHTSGIPNYTGFPGWVVTNARRDLSVEEMLGEWQDLPLEFDPGSKFNYSNSGYFMLGAIIEAVSGMDYGTFIAKKIFRPLAMNSSYYGGHSQVVPRRVHGYHSPEGRDGWINAPFLDMDIPHAAGSLLSTVDDLAKWDAALYTDILLPASVRERMWTPYKLSRGEATSYGYGWGIGEVGGRKSLHHSGGIFGFRTMVIRIPEEKIYVAVLTNGGQLMAEPTAKAVVRALLDDGFEAKSLKAIDPALYASYSGRYELAPNFILEVWPEGGRLLTRATGQGVIEIFPESETVFVNDDIDGKITFIRGDTGEISMLILEQGGNRTEARRLLEE